MPNINEYLCVFHEACAVTGRRIQQRIKQTRSLLSESLKQLSPNLTSLVPEKCQPPVTAALDVGIPRGRLYTCVVLAS